MDAGRKAYEKGQYDKAIKEYLKIVKEDPKDVRVWLKIGDLYAKKDAKAEATDTYMKVAKFYSEQGFYLKAVAVYKQILKVDPRLVEVNLKLAELYRQLGLLSDAMQHFEMVAAFFHREGKTREALATLRQLVDLDPENVATRIKLAELYSKEQMVPEAISEFGTTCEYLRKNNRQDDFIKVAERLVFHDPENISVCQELATLYLQRNDPRRALAKLQICFKDDQNNPVVLGLLAQAFQRLDQKGKTVSVLKELARVHSESGKRKEAEGVHAKILEYVPNDPDSLKFLGRTAKPSSLAESVEFDLGDEPVAAPPNRFGANKMGRTTGSMPLVKPSEDEHSLGDSDVADYRASEDDFVADLELDEPVGYDSTEQSGVEAQENADEIVKILTETDVYVKYGLHQKAIDHLRRVFDLDVRNIEARERLQDILIKEGRESEAVRELLVLAEHTVKGNPELALSYIRQILSLDGSNVEALEFAERHRLDLGGEGTSAPDDPSGHLAFTSEADELEFEDLAFDEMPMGGRMPSEMVGAPVAPVAGSASVTRREDVDYDFGIDDDSEARPITMEVDLGQVEQAVSVAEFDADELDFDLDPPGDPFAPPPLTDPPVGDLEFDAADAAAFDADRAYSDLDGPDLDDEFEEIAEIAADDIEEIDSSELIIANPVEAAAMASVPTETAESFSVERAASVATSLEDDLDEADFFLSQGLYDEAREILGSLSTRHPGNLLVAAKLQEIDGIAMTTQAEQELIGDLDDSFLDSALANEVKPPTHRAPSVVLERPVDEDDSDTHFDLGQAYKEMGLYNEAIQAFEKVMESAGREVQCRLMMGLCHREQGSLSEAISQFKAGLYVSDISGPEKFSLYYEIGFTYEGLQDPQEALYYYEMVLKKEPGYRDVAKRVSAIKGAGDRADA